MAVSNNNRRTPYDDTVYLLKAQKCCRLLFVISKTCITLYIHKTLKILRFVARNCQVSRAKRLDAGAGLGFINSACNRKQEGQVTKPQLTTV